jgi:co-chaperonin GroES (HSP10)
MEQFEGTVLAIGAEVERVKTGDYVSFARHGFSIKRWKDEEYFFLLEEAIHTVESKVDEGVECEQNEFFI